MAEKPEDLNLPNAVISRLAKEAVRLFNLEFSKKKLHLNVNTMFGCWRLRNE